mmetsp:Transcript_28603/g.43966  ORF Transcript_28603/g.43966 Transcript_28603/m.43966 type:complete len:135 (+) Transcript_28603:143-547(+)|eukprot:CAMPEP_0118673556 /NCGR_PEP_ID=MMETSP0800-20121206/393_1 /TAXON_ID=210618 ORGANISM="Striatella unipunctata, Strain CCMP2910" /NCGR_SAMPLE_ID=MMETSP0800 /ASSEMBLY_ACC=CAM_ASM_000638 /LENGTH=134 /DNA_ID=CAMNT_0006568643 /DNA_START=69 /DNA_END=473 /DNA_ORIENTATION=+
MSEEDLERKLLILISQGVSDRKQASNQSSALSLMKARKVPYVFVDGMDASQRDARNELFKISGIRGNYPQFFFIFSDGTISYIGDWDHLESINEADSLPPDVLEQNPQVETWTRVFGKVVKQFGDADGEEDTSN